MKKIINNPHVGWVADSDWLLIKAVQNMPRDSQEKSSMIIQSGDYAKFELYPFEDQKKGKSLTHKVFLGKNYWKLVKEELIDPLQFQLENVNQVLSKGNMSNRFTHFGPSPLQKILNEAKFQNTIKDSKKNLVDWDNVIEMDKLKRDTAAKTWQDPQQADRVLGRQGIKPIMELTSDTKEKTLVQEIKEIRLLLQVLLESHEELAKKLVHKSVEESGEKYVVGCIDVVGCIEIGTLIFCSTFSRKGRVTSFTTRLRDVKIFESYDKAKEAANKNQDIDPEIYLYSDLQNCNLNTSHLISKEIKK